MPLSPPLSSSGELLQQGFHPLVQHNMTTSFPSEAHFVDGSYQNPHYNPPTPAEGDEGTFVYHDTHSPYDYSSQNSDIGMTTPYESAYSSDYNGSVYQDIYSTPETSPPQYTDTMKTRSGLGIPRGQQPLRPMPEGRSRNKEVAKPKRNRKDRAKSEKRIAKLDQPLSILTKDWLHVPIVDIEAYVNRSAEVRRREVDDGKNPGKVKRPMNSFMLYRKAYQNRTKDWCLQNNHQVVSQVCGDSWPLEPEAIKEQFSEWARIERINHQNAHPGYKFSPTKPGTTKSGKRKVSEEPMSEESDLDDYDWRGESNTSKRSKKGRPVPRSIAQSPIQSVVYPSTQSAYQYTSRDTSPEPGRPSYHQSSYQVHNPGRPHPAPYQQHIGAGEYYQQSLHQYHSIPGSQEVILKRASNPGTGHSYHGLPNVGGPEYELIQPYTPFDHYPTQQRIDPSLMSPNQRHHPTTHFDEASQHAYSLSNSPVEDKRWQQPIYGMDRSPDRKDLVLPYLDVAPEHSPEHINPSQLGGFEGHKDPWHETLETGNEFDKWMEDDHILVS